MRFANRDFGSPVAQMWSNGVESESSSEDEALLLRGAVEDDAVRAHWVEDPVMPHTWWTGGPSNRKRLHQKVFYPFTWHYVKDGEMKFYSFSWQKLIDETYVRGIATTGFDATVTLFNDDPARRPTDSFLEIDLKNVEAAQMWANTGLKRKGRSMKVERTKKREMANLIGLDVDDALQLCRNIQGNSDIVFAKSHEREMLIERYDKCFVRFIYDATNSVTMVKRT